MKKVRMSTGLEQWRDGDLITITFCVTQECNFACSYCYMVGKNNKHPMSYEMARKIVDFVLNNEFLRNMPAVAWDFIGGEPLLEMELIDRICDYIVVKMYAMNHPWFKHYRFTFSTNGSLYGTDAVRKFIDKHEGHAYFGLSIDGTKEKHDVARKYKDGRGTYDDVVKNVKLWLHDFPNGSTKATFAHDDIKYLKDSIIHLWNLGIKDVMANIVYEDVWQEGDDILYENQLKELADYVVENELWDDFSVAFFDESVGLPLSKSEQMKNRCGSGYKSLAFDDAGNIYPCIRFLDMCSDTKKKYIIGHINEGINMNLLGSLSCTSWRAVSPQKCLECEVGTGCGWCVANNYDDSNIGSIFKRTTYLCDMHKANARASQYFWNQYLLKTRKTSSFTVAKVMRRADDSLRYMYFITESSIQPHCSYKINKNVHETMDEAVLKQGLIFCLENNLAPVFLGNINHGLNHDDHLYYEIIDSRKVTENEVALPIYYGKVDAYEKAVNDSVTAILLLTKENLLEITLWVSLLLKRHLRINLFVQDSEEWGAVEYDEYRRQLITVSDLLYNSYEEENAKQINVLTDLMFFSEPHDCGAGSSSITLAPNGDLYVCPGFYFDEKASKKVLGNIGSKEICLDKHFYKRTASEPCIDCPIKNCNRCRYTNYIYTNEIHIPTEKQCRLNYINGEISNVLQNKLEDAGFLEGSKYVNDRRIGKYKTILEKTNVY